MKKLSKGKCLMLVDCNASSVAHSDSQHRESLMYFHGMVLCLSPILENGRSGFMVARRFA